MCPGSVDDLLMPASLASVLPKRWQPRVDAGFGEDHTVATVVAPRDGLVIGRMIAIVVIAGLVLTFDDGRDSVAVAALMLVIATLQPVMAWTWPHTEQFRQAQVFSDLATFVVLVAIAPDYYWLAVITLASVIANHAVMASLRHYVPAALCASVAVAVLGETSGVSTAGQVSAMFFILVVGHGYMGYSTRAATQSARRDLLSAVTAAGGLAHLVDLTAAPGVVDIVGDVERVVGWSKEEWMTIDHREIIHPEDIDDYWLDVDDLEVGTVVDRMARVRTRDGRWTWIRDMSRVVVHGQRLHLRGFSIDVSAQQDGLDRFENEATTDSLTGLRNRRWLLSELSQRESTSNYFLVLIDLNRFKHVNDTLGHEAGDELLEVVADRLTMCLRPDDVLARLGGDEFAIVMDDMPDAAAVAAAVERFAWEVSRPVEISGVTLTTSLSAGIAHGIAGESSATELLRHADIAMYTAKRERRVSATFDADLEQRSDRRSALSTSLSSALSTHDLTLHYQPIIEVETGRVAGAEGLARWQHDEYGLLRPDSFLDVILMSERSGDFTRAMVADAIGAARRVSDEGFELPISVNLPIRAVEDSDFETWFVAECGRQGVSPSQLVFEIAERDLHHTDLITVSIDRLSRLGVTISVDDFGAGNATFERLRWRNVDQLKLDSGVMRNAVKDDRERAILRSVIGLASELGYDVVAEGVERDDQMELLRRFGCSHVQGHLFAGAMPLDDLVRCLEAGRLAADAHRV